jgi:hypothetical protein
MSAGRLNQPPDGRSRGAAGCRPPPGPGDHGPPAVPAPPVTRPDGAAARDRSARRSRQQGSGGSSEHPPPSGRECRLAVCHGGLHAGGEEQGADRHPTLQAGIHLAGGLNPVGQLTRSDEGCREDDLTRE